MGQKEFAVFGLGEFGRSVAITLEKNGCEVLAIDKDEDKIKEIADYVTHAVQADASDPEVLRTLGLKNIDRVIVAIGENLEASIMATIISKECGVPYILAKARNEVQATVLRKIGADEIIFPERAMGLRTAMNLISGSFLDIFELSSDFSMVEVSIPQNWVGKTLRQLNLRKLGLNVVVKKVNNKVELTVDPDEILKAEDQFIIIGDNSSLDRIV